MSTIAGTRLLLAHFFATAALTGLIWTIQIVHYPLFSQVGPGRFVTYQKSHSFRISTLVGPLMGGELICALIIIWKRPVGISPPMAWGSLALLLLIHSCTVLFSVRAHNILGRGFDAAAHRMLVNTNWIRTLGWTIRAALAAYMLSQFIGELPSAVSR